MIAEAEVFLRADEAAVEVFTSIHDDRWDTVLPPVFDMPGADQPAGSATRRWSCTAPTATARCPTTSGS
jgi:hypothetical protein